jgi:hypothetical protein
MIAETMPAVSSWDRVIATSSRPASPYPLEIVSDHAHKAGDCCHRDLGLALIRLTAGLG